MRSREEEFFLHSVRRPSSRLIRADAAGKWLLGLRRILRQRTRVAAVYRCPIIARFPAARSLAAGPTHPLAITPEAPGNTNTFARESQIDLLAAARN
jgi:hypothetical protein